MTTTSLKLIPQRIIWKQHEPVGIAACMILKHVHHDSSRGGQLNLGVGFHHLGCTALFEIKQYNPSRKVHMNKINYLIWKQGL